MKVNDEAIFKLQYLARTYDGTNKLLVSTKNRLHALNPEAEPEHQDEIKAIESLKGKLSRRIEHELTFWPIWDDWLSEILGIGPFIASNLILLYYYKFIPVCKNCGADLNREDEDGNESENGNGKYKCMECGKKSKGDGVLKHRIEDREHPCISAWWSHLGEGNDPETGRMVKMKKGVRCNWSPKGRNISWMIGEAFNKCKPDHLYKQFLNKRKERKEKTHPDLPPYRKHNMAKREARKLFLSHFWAVARELEGKPVIVPYAQGPLGHSVDKIIKPYYWESSLVEAMAA